MLGTEDRCSRFSFKGSCFGQRQEGEITAQTDLEPETTTITIMVIIIIIIIAVVMVMM